MFSHFCPCYQQITFDLHQNYTLLTLNIKEASTYWLWYWYKLPSGWPQKTFHLHKSNRLLLLNAIHSDAKKDIFLRFSSLQGFHILTSDDIKWHLKFSRTNRLLRSTQKGINYPSRYIEFTSKASQTKTHARHHHDCMGLRDYHQKQNKNASKHQDNHEIMLVSVYLGLVKYAQKN